MCVAGSREIVHVEVCTETFKGFSDRLLFFLSISRYWKTKERDPNRNLKKIGLQ